MTAPTPPSEDVSATLRELERKLQELEEQLAGSEPADAPAAPVASTPTASLDAPPDADADRLVAEARARLGGLDREVDELLRFRERLQRTTRELEDEYERLLTRLGALSSDAPPPPS